ncbi:OpgC domain-containing protein [Piscibacillus halophilus]|uniref:OpgC domain-containing protein n=1 Tax=Piscibacillus halophilus TaxID=571933 RepID=UPI00158C512C|nr:OpgC domain-containing protein [Piscibacillus halophilus]
MTQQRNTFIDFARSLFMLFVFLHHFYLTFPLLIDYVAYINPFAELFVLLSGFMVGWIYFYRHEDKKLVKKGVEIIGAYLIVAIPIQIFASLFINKGNLLLDTLNVVLLNTSNTFIEILKFYGLMFLLLPLVFKVYRFNKKLTIVLSVTVFTAALNIHGLNFIPVWGEPLKLMMIYQLYFIIGLLVGDLYKQDKANMQKVIKMAIILGYFAFAFHIIGFFNVEKGENYSVVKFFNTVYLVPIYLYLFYKIHEKIKDGKIESTILIIGRNSLAAFVISEYMRFWLVAVPYNISLFSMNEVSATICSFIFAAALIYTVRMYELRKNLLSAKGGVLQWGQ